MQINNSGLPTIEEIRQYLTGFYQEGGEHWQKENEHYMRMHAHRFYKTLAALPPGKQGNRVLELGSPPYFMTLLLKHYYDYTLFLAKGIRANGPQKSSVKLINRNSREEYTFDYESFNVEIDCFPYPDHSFDLVLCCELIEHLILDPTHMLAEIHRVLVPSGRVIITTPNVLVLRNIVSLLKHRRNIYSPYSSYGVYGRHNREWTLEELVQLVSECGFSIEKSQIVDTYPHHGYSKLFKRFFPFLRDMLVVVGRAENEAIRSYPANLYESYPKQFLAENTIPSRMQLQKQRIPTNQEEERL